MAFNTLQIRYQTARSLPAPYAYFYTLTATPAGSQSLQVELAITYPDREDIDDDELIAEGFTRDDDVAWSGQLPKPWLDTLTSLVAKTRLQPLDEEALDDEDDFWDITISTATAHQQGTPQKTDDWQYVMQELMQAAFESMGRERPFELIFLDRSTSTGVFELKLTASFASRSVTALTTQDHRQSSRTLPWAALQRIMSQVYAHDFDPDETQLKRPVSSGQWLNLGTDEWYTISALKKLCKALREL